MFKKILTGLLAVCMISAFTVTASADFDEWENGISDLREREFCGVVLGVQELGLVVGNSYTIEFTVDNLFTSGFRVRYKGDGAPFGDFETQNDTNNSAHSSDAARSNGLVANQIPALFGEDTVPTMSVSVLTVNFTLGESIPDLDPLYLNYIGLFGLYGETTYSVLGVVVKDAAGNVIASRGEPVATAAAPAATTAPAATDDTPAATTDTAPAATAGNTAVVPAGDKDGADTGAAGIATVIGVIAVATTGVIVSAKKRK
jgi:hypothetical protein